MTPSPGRDGVTTGDVLLTLAALCLLAALAYPRIRRERVLASADFVATDVDSLSAAARRYRAHTGAWPRHAPPGQLPAGLSTADTAGPTMTTPRYRLEWNVWERPAPLASGRTPPDSTPPGTPPRQDAAERPTPLLDTLAGITVHGSDPRVLELLLERYGDARSFVRDSSWTLVLPDLDGR